MAKKGQTFNRYDEATKKEAVRLRLEEQWSYPMIMDKFGIKSETQIMNWVRKAQNGESFEDYRGKWTKKHFNSAEEEIAHLKAQVEYPKKAQSKSTWGGKLDKQARFESIREMTTSFTTVLLCKIADVSRAGYYKWLSTYETRQARLDEDTVLKEHILAIHRIRPHYGYFRMRTALRKEGLTVNHKKVRRLMRELGIQSVIRKKRPFAGRKPSVLFPNVLNREFTATAAKLKLVTDITYVRVGHEFLYLSVILDLFNNEVMAWKLSARNDLELVLETVKQLKTPKASLHSDQGFQYTTKTYAKLLEDHGLQGSHSRRGNCFDNACIESFFSHLKTEKLHLAKPKSEVEAKQLIAEYITYYNQERFQKKLGDRSPVEFRNAIAA
ncbi:IS3 family transposase [Paenibacillus curdlanolyticus]|uniref:IS3 family transposase n=1 Tax=Paenibacillus curdlanolyticus TaxID=59840 RepID=UPI000A2F8B9C